MAAGGNARPEPRGEAGRRRGLVDLKLALDTETALMMLEPGEPYVDEAMAKLLDE